MDCIRIWTEIDIQEIDSHIIMVDDTLGYCHKCKTIGIDIRDIKKCPSCGREIRYVTSTEAKGGRPEIVSRIRKKLPHLAFVDYDDYIRLTGKKKAESLFKA